MQGHTFARAMALGTALTVVAAMGAAAQDIASFEKRLKIHKLDNGLTFLIYERPTAPVVSFFTHVDAGGAQEVPGITGLAHMFEHMAFKGTSRIGTTDFAAEKKALEIVDATYHAYDRARRDPLGADPERVEVLRKAWKDAQETAGGFIKANEFGEIIDREGGVGLNAFTSSDETGYFYSLPANKVELWAHLESERFLDPVFREFYKERDVVMEERRLRTESNPIGRMIEQFIMASYTAHPYKQPVVGYMSDLMAFSREDAEAFFLKHYVPANMTIAIVGAVKATEIVPILDRYFGRLEKRPKPDPLRTVEPKQIAERTVVIPDRAQPVYVEGYHRPNALDPDDAAYAATADVLSTGRTSRLYRSLVRDKKIAAQVGAFGGFPGDKYASMMLFFAIPAPGATNEAVRDAIRAEIDKISSEPITDDEMKMVKTRAKANLIRGLADNQGLAIQLASAQARYGDWREIFRSVEKIDAVTKEDILRVARSTFIRTNRTVGMIENSDQASN